MTKARKVHLVKIVGNRYSFYINKKRIITVESDVGITPEQLEQYRLDPVSLKMELMNYYNGDDNDSA